MGCRRNRLESGSPQAALMHIDELPKWLLAGQRCCCCRRPHFTASLSLGQSQTARPLLPFSILLPTKFMPFPSPPSPSTDQHSIWLTINAHFRSVTKEPARVSHLSSLQFLTSSLSVSRLLFSFFSSSHSALKWK